ncbi:MAG: type IX secretion system sortase PorU [Muribaculaceae bacterium]
MKRASKFLKVLFGAAALLVSGTSVQALSLSHFAEQSKLATGRWVKVATEADGVHEITAAQLAEMGFHDPSKVKIFGSGGHILPESIEASITDDLAQVPAIYTNGKLCFYAQSPLKRDVYFSSAANYFRYTANAYSSHAYYFLTDDEAYSPLAPAEARQPSSAPTSLTTSYNNYHHERDLTSPGFTGKSILGENFGSDNALSFTFNLPGFIDGSQVNVYTNFGVNSGERSTISATLNGTDVVFSSNSNRVSAATSEYTFYNIGQARGYTTAVDAPDGNITYSMSLASEGGILLALLDNFTVTYEQRNELPADMAQLDLFFFNQTNAKIDIAGLSPEAMVWNVTSASAPATYVLSTNGDTRSFNTSMPSTCEHMVAFDPTRQLHTISSYSVVENQNLHALATPDMVILTTPGLKAQAQRIADYHASADGMDVAVVEQQHIFNEFSSGAVDATAVRLFMKMLHLRNPEKLKYLLIFGGGTYDNRHILADRSENLVVTFQSTTSNMETKSYSCDDYFGLLADNTGYAISSAPVSIAVGRFPVKTVEEAEASVDKLMRYLTDEKGQWCNNALLVADQGDNDMHMYQAEGIVDILKLADINLSLTKLYPATYPQQGSYATDLRQQWINKLNEGCVYMSYIGHGGPTSFGKETILWVTPSSKALKNKHLPFMTLATCDAAPFDSDHRGVGEELFMNPDGGMIAGMMSTRVVFASENDDLNRAMANYLFNLDENGNQRTIGEAYRMAKNSFLPNENYNKLNFILFGDPAMKLHMPKELINISTINGSKLVHYNATVSPLSSVKVTGDVLNADGSVNKSFSGKVDVTLYDKSRFYRSFSQSSSKPVRDSYYSPDVLARTQATVANGSFAATFVVPKQCLAHDEAALISAIAVSDDAKTVVNGYTDHIIISAFNPDAAIADNEAPVIEAMYLDDAANTGIARTGTSATLYATVTDDVAINSRSLAIGSDLEITLDGGVRSLTEARNTATVCNEGKSLIVELPISDLSYGSHTLTLAASDAAGNRTTRTIDFVVENSANVAEITADALDARSEVAFAISHTLGDDAVATVTVTDAMHRTVWTATTSAAECKWNLSDLTGARVAPGRYSFHCTVRNATGYAASAPATLVVLAPAQ